METAFFHRPIQTSDKLTNGITHRREQSYIQSELEEAEIRVKMLKNMIEDRKTYPDPIITGSLYLCDSAHFNEMLYPRHFKTSETYGRIANLSFDNHYEKMIDGEDVLGNLYHRVGNKSEIEIIKIPEIHVEAIDIIHTFAGSLTFFQNEKIIHSEFRCILPVKLFKGETNKDSGDTISLRTDLGEIMVLILWSNTRSLTFKESLNRSLTGRSEQSSSQHNNE